MDLYIPHWHAGRGRSDGAVASVLQPERYVVVEGCFLHLAWSYWFRSCLAVVADEGEGVCVVLLLAHHGEPGGLRVRGLHLCHEGAGEVPTRVVRLLWG